MTRSKSLCYSCRSEWCRQCKLIVSLLRLESIEVTILIPTCTTNRVSEVLIHGVERVLSSLIHLGTLGLSGNTFHISRKARNALVMRLTGPSLGP